MSFLKKLLEKTDIVTFKGKRGIWRTTPGGTRIFIPSDGDTLVLPRKGPDLELPRRSGRSGSGTPGTGGNSEPVAKSASRNLPPTLVPSTKASRVGIPGNVVLPPPGVPRLPNTTTEEKMFEGAFASAFEDDPDKLSSAFAAAASTQSNVFETDGAKSLMHDWQRPDLPPDERGKPVHPERAAFRARYNSVLHQTANAVAKRAFLSRLDDIAKLPEDKRKILVTSGGVAAGKGVALGARPDLPASVSATWDAAGEQNATENAWVLEESRKRGIKPTFLFVHAEPEARWKGAVARAKGIGRMVDARVFADSYAEGARNFEKFRKKHEHEADFVMGEVEFPPGQKPTVKMHKAVPPAALAVDADALYQKALSYIDKEHKEGRVSDDIHAGATAGRRIWKT